MMLVPGTYYHIYNHANGDDNLFRDERNYPFFLEKYHHHIDPIADTIAWCLMPNHFHLLVKIKSEEELFFNFFNNFSKVRNFGKVEKVEKVVENVESKFLSKQFSNFFSSYTQAFNKVYGRRGSLFIKNFKRKEVLDENYLRNLILYIHLNPVKHGFTKTIEDWEHTSFHVFPTEHIALMNLLFGDYSNYQVMHRPPSDFFGYENLENELT